MLGFILLGERVSLIEATSLVVSFAGVFLLVINDKKKTQNSINHNLDDFEYVTSWILLLSCPVLMAVGAIQTR